VTIWFLVDPLKLIVGTLWQVEEGELVGEGGALVSEVVDGHHRSRFLKHPMRLVLVVEIQWHKACSTALKSY
jgi:hypothetical protein